MTKKLIKYGILFGFSFVFMLYYRIISANTIDTLLITDAYLWYFLFCVITAFIFDTLKTRFPNWKIIKLFIIGFILNVTISVGFSTTMMRFFNPELLKDYYISELGAIVLFVFMVSTGYCVYLAMQRIHHNEKSILKSQKEKDKMQLELLERQINPHFLFNNLAILSTFIDSGNSKEANTFLNRLSRIYRYIIANKSEDFVPLFEEIDIAKDYVYLLQQRFVNQFVFDFNIEENALRTYYIIPNSIQILLENIEKHNQGMSSHPIKTEIKIKDDYLYITNACRPKNYAVDSTKTGLENLKQRHVLLIQKTLKITSENDSFSVGIPLIKKEG